MERGTMLCWLGASASVLVGALAIVFLSAFAAQGEWAPDGVPIFTTSIDATHEGVEAPVVFSMMPDGYGGAIIVWPENQDGSGQSTNILAQRIDAHGNFLWTAPGVTVGTMASMWLYPSIVSDGSGGAVILWDDGHNGDYTDVYAQRLDADGNPLWAVGGVSVWTAAGGLSVFRALPSGADGVIILATRYFGDNRAIYAQRIDMQGNALWGADGIAISDTMTSLEYACAGSVSDGSGGALIAWGRFNTAGTWLQRIDQNGIRLWSAGGISISSGPAFLGWDMMPDGSGGAILAWEGSQSGGGGIYAQRVSGNGHVLWTPNGVPCSAPSYATEPRLIPDGSGGAIVSWTVDQPGIFMWDILAQRVDANGNVLWADGGVPVSVAPYWQECAAPVSDGMGGGIFAWTDMALAWETGDVYCQRITGEGNMLWAARGVPVSTAPDFQGYTYCVTDGAGGALITWWDSRSGKKAAYIQRIDRNGYWGYPSPTIEAVRDVPGDQGGFVNLAWHASRLDPWPDESISSYTVWRAISPKQATLVLRSGGALLSNLAELGSEPSKPLIRIEKAATRTFYWKLVSTVNAYHLDSYSEVVPTLFDSSGASKEYHYFQVIAHGNDPRIYWISAPDSGRSVDNLAPAPPADLSGTAFSNPDGLRLVWKRGGEPDLDHYAVYRGSSAGFEPTPGNRITAIPDTTYVDGEWRAGSGRYYKVRAVDVHGNESGCSLLRPEDISYGDTPRTPAATFLAQNCPNPFNPSTKIVFGLKEPAFVSLRIYDAAGRLVRVLVEGDRASGVYEERWNGLDARGTPMSSGVYFCRMKAGSFTSLKKMVLLR